MRAKKGHHLCRCPIFRSQSGEEQKKHKKNIKKDHHVRSCPIFRPKLREEQKQRSSYPRAVEKFFRKIFHTASESLKCASGSLDDPRVAFLCNVPSTSRTLLFFDKAWVYIPVRHYFLDYNDFFIAQ